MNRKKVIIADMDNTLCESCRPISDEIAQEIDRIVGSGYIFAVISGSKPEHIYEQVARYLDASIHLLGNSGTRCYFGNKNGIKEIFSDNLSSASRIKIRKALEGLCKEFNLIPLTSKEDQIQDRGTQITFSVLGRNASHDLKEAYDTNAGKRKKFMEWLSPRLRDFEVRIGGTTSIDITKKGRDKGVCIKEFCKRNGVEARECLFFGDSIYAGGNDYSIKGFIDYVSVKNPEETLAKFKRL